MHNHLIILKKKVYNWLENHGEVFLRRNLSIGKNLMRAKMLHLSHENFVKVLKVSCFTRRLLNLSLEKKQKSSIFFENPAILKI